MGLEVTPVNRPRESGGRYLGPPVRSLSRPTLFDDFSGLETADVFFVPVAAACLRRVAQEGLALEGLERYSILHRARHAAGADKRVLAISADAADEPIVPPQAIRNLEPYREPEQVEAGGGIVIRLAAKEPEVLLIHRRGTWDLPKGEPEPGEQIEQCALREVREELGIRLLAYIEPAGMTLHGYPEGERYIIKRTTWLFLITPEISFRPQREEGIDRAEWFAWSDACERLGYPNLRRHLRQLGAEAVREVLDLWTQP